MEDSVEKFQLSEAGDESKVSWRLSRSDGILLLFLYSLVVGKWDWWQAPGKKLRHALMG